MVLAVLLAALVTRAQLAPLERQEDQDHLGLLVIMDHQVRLEEKDRLVDKVSVGPQDV